MCKITFEDGEMKLQVKKNLNYKCVDDGNDNDCLVDFSPLLILNFSLQIFINTAMNKRNKKKD